MLCVIVNHLEDVHIGKPVHRFAPIEGLFVVRVAFQPSLDIFKGNLRNTLELGQLARGAQNRPCGRKVEVVGLVEEEAVRWLVVPDISLAEIATAELPRITRGEPPGRDRGKIFRAPKIAAQFEPGGGQPVVDMSWSQAHRPQTIRPGATTPRIVASMAGCSALVVRSAACATALTCPDRVRTGTARTGTQAQSRRAGRKTTAVQGQGDGVNCVDMGCCLVVVVRKRSDDLAVAAGARRGPDLTIRNVLEVLRPKRGRQRCEAAVLSGKPCSTGRTPMGVRSEVPKVIKTVDVPG